MGVVRIKALLIVAALEMAVCSFGAQAKEGLPAHVTTKPFSGGKNQAIDAIDYSFVAAAPVAFSRVKLCIASNVTNNAVELRDNAGSFVGATGTYHRSGDSSTVQGGSLFKYVDDASGSLVAQGSIRRQGGLGGIIKLALRFDLEVRSDGTNVKMRMLHIEEAMQDTGSASNSGFHPVGVWTGSMYKKNIQALDALAGELKSCMST